eukprot:gb/GEZJ01008239.1/.p1 GENE.gb/GEZJ01008239.1/~~gb/GEZJ01008239.1/.p1  ORF type:complete len:134 (-),score=7.63 gb/GEZJ01008239.1/:465-866(-)
MLLGNEFMIRYCIWIAVWSMIHIEMVNLSRVSNLWQIAPKIVHGMYIAWNSSLKLISGKHQINTPFFPTNVPMLFIAKLRLDFNRMLSVQSVSKTLCHFPEVSKAQLMICSLLQSCERIPQSAIVRQTNSKST